MTHDRATKRPPTKRAGTSFSLLVFAAFCLLTYLGHIHALWLGLMGRRRRHNRPRIDAPISPRYL
ncbi:MAG: hypothetical protein ACK2UH_08715 [Candidatus Promineifilaceae bacterium]